VERRQRQTEKTCDEQKIRKNPHKAHCYADTGNAHQRDDEPAGIKLPDLIEPEGEGESECYDAQQAGGVSGLTQDIFHGTQPSISGTAQWSCLIHGRNHKLSVRSV
jgi:hypothetical protein